MIETSAARQQQAQHVHVAPDTCAWCWREQYPGIPFPECWSSTICTYHAECITRQQQERRAKARALARKRRRAAYPRNWPKLARRCKLLAGWRCEQCGIRQGDHYTARSGKDITCYLHAAHLDHDKSNPRPRLRALCPTCHGLYDCAWREREARVHLERVRHQTLLTRRGKARHG